MALWVRWVVEMVDAVNKKAAVSPSALVCMTRVARRGRKRHKRRSSFRVHYLQEHLLFQAGHPSLMDLPGSRCVPQVSALKGNLHNLTPFSSL